MSKPFAAARLRRSRSFVRLSGVSVATFNRMLTQLRDSWDAEERQAQARTTLRGRRLEDHLLVMLIYYRCYVTQEFIGFFYKVDRSAVCRAIKRIETYVRPLYAVRRDPKIDRSKAEALIIDCTEQPICRPKATPRKLRTIRARRSATRSRPN